MTKSIVDRSPRGALRFGLRLPIWLYRMKLGWILGNRLLMLTHTGRKSRRLHQTVIEVVHHDKQTDTFYVASGWGEKSDWYQNLRRLPYITVHVGGRKFRAIAEFIPLGTAIQIMETYAREHPVAFSELSRLFLEEHMKPDNDVLQRIAAKMPMVAFHPMQSTES